jgi:cystathionine gamma-synthase
LQEHLTWWANCTGVTGAPFDSYMTLRGLKTLYARLSQQEKSAEKIARFLDAAPGIKQVYFPGLESHPGHEIAARQQSGFGAMLSFELVGGLQAVRAFTSRLSLFTLAESLGGVESLVAHPTTMTHAAMDPEARKEAGIGDGLLRLSVGIEYLDDLIDDLQNGLDALDEVADSDGEEARDQVKLRAVSG